MVSVLLRILAYLWASPWTLFGLCGGLFALLTGGGVQFVRGVLEFHGGLPAWILSRAPLVGGASAITFGHTVLARTREDLADTRDHGRIHVRQYERWGLFFIPAYLACSLWFLLRGGNPYRDNPFEREAYLRG